MGSTADHHPLIPQAHLLVDERVVWLWENVREKPPFGLHRYQTIRVRRGQYLCDFVKDLGAAVLFPVAYPFQFPAFGEYSVGEAMEIAESLREGKPPVERESTDIVGEWQKQLDEKRALRAHRTVSGPLIRVERS